jgi:serine protease AprX
VSFRSRSIVAVCAVALVGLGLTAVPGAAKVPTKRPAAPAQRPPFAGLADADGNGLADVLDRRLQVAHGKTIEVIATFTDRASMVGARGTVAAAQVSTTLRLIDGFVATLTPGQIRSMAARDGTLRIEPNVAVHALDDAANDDFGATAARTTFGLTGAGTKICIPDSGVDLGHEQLDSKAPIQWHDYVNGRSTPYDDMGHGTEVASIALGDGTGASIAGLMRGVAPGAALAAAKVIDSTGNGADADEILAIQWCAGMASVDVISISLGSDLTSDGNDAISQAVDAAVGAGKVVVAAAGNAGDAAGTITSPGSARKAITVGAAADWSAASNAPYASDGPYPAFFSSRGPTADGRIKPDVLGPGVSIGAALATTQATYTVSDGTSFSTPYVAGIAAMLKQAQPAWTPANVRSAIEGTAVDAGPAGKDNDWGAGLVDGYAAVAQAESASGASSFPVHERFTGSAPNNGSWAHSFTLGTSDLNAPVAVTITMNGSVTCVIDVGPLGCFQYGFAPDLDAAIDGPNGFTVVTSTCPAGNECAYGRQETLHFRPSQAGTYTIRVYPDPGGNGAGGSFGVDVFHGPVGTGSPPPPPPPAQKSHIGDLDPSAAWVTSSRWRARATVQVNDQNGSPRAGAVVTGVWTGNTTLSCTTDATGRCFVQKRFASKKASVTFTVTNVQLTGYPYDASANTDPDGDSNGTAVTVVRPA